jgi:hypothetical protein
MKRPKITVPKKRTRRKLSGHAIGRSLTEHLHILAWILALIVATATGAGNVKIRLPPLSGTHQQ